MNIDQIPWVELSILIPLAGAGIVRFIRSTPHAAFWTLGFTIITFCCSLMPWMLLTSNNQIQSWDPFTYYFGRHVFLVDQLSAPLLPLVAILHVLTVLATAKVKMNRMSFTGHLTGESIRLAIFACIDPWSLIALVTLGAIPPLLEMIQRGKSTRVYFLHMLLCVALLIAGWAGVEAHEEWGSILLLAAILVRSGTFPAHLWVPELFEHATFGTALLYMTPITGVYVALRLVLPIAPDWVLQSIGVASLITAIYAAGLSVVQREARRFFAYLFLSHASLVLVGLELHTTISLTGALCLWISVALSMGGLGLTLRAVEARFGRLRFDSYRGLYDQSPALAVCFLVTGLGSVGFPGTLGFIASELLMDGAIDANLFVGFGLVIASMINGIAVVRVYLLLFTGNRHVSSVPLGITPKERFAVLTLTALILGGGLYPQLGVINRFAAAEQLMKQARQE